MTKVIYNSPDQGEDEKTSNKRILYPEFFDYDHMCYRTNKGDLCSKCLYCCYTIVKNTKYPSWWFTIPIGYGSSRFNKIFQETYKCTDCSGEYMRITKYGEMGEIELKYENNSIK